MIPHYHGLVDLTLSIDDAVLRAARAHAEASGTSVEELVCQFLDRLARKAEITEFRRLSLGSKGNSEGWKFNRDEIQRYP